MNNWKLLALLTFTSFSTDLAQANTQAKQDIIGERLKTCKNLNQCKKHGSPSCGHAKCKRSLASKTKFPWKHRKAIQRPSYKDPVGLISSPFTPGNTLDYYREPGRRYSLPGVFTNPKGHPWLFPEEIKTR